jgi:hypothetical protein
MASSGADDASGAIKQATAMSVAEQEKMFQEMKQILAPYVGFGLESLDKFKSALPDLLKTFNPTMQQLEGTPGYKFALGQGLTAGQNKLTSMGLGNSGAAVQGAEQFAQGLASTTYQQAFNNDLTNRTTGYNMLMQPVQMGANAAAMQGNNAMTLGTNIGNTYSNEGNQLASIAMNNAAQQNQLLGTVVGGVLGFL